MKARLLARSVGQFAAPSRQTMLQSANDDERLQPGTKRMTDSAERLFSEKRLAWNVTWSLFGTAFPLVVAAWAIPRLISTLGADRFGLLTLIWAGVGYFSLFDMGFGRAVTKLIAQRLGDGRGAEVGAFARTSLQTLGIIGVVAAGILVAAAPWIVRRVLSVSGPLSDEATISFTVLALTTPIVISTAGFVGVLQAHQRFVSLSSVQAVLGAATFAAPLAAVTVSRSLVSATLAVGASRLMAWGAYRWLCRDVLSQRSSAAPSPQAIRRELVRFGGWVTVSNVVGPIMVYVDRFVVAALVTITAVAYYTTPYEMVTRLWVVADGIVAVIFPAVATALASNPGRARSLLAGATRAMTSMMVVPIGLIVLFSSELLTAWLGGEFARMSSLVLRWLAIGVFINAVARLPFVALQASGRPDVTAKVHLLELPIYLVILWLLIQRFGIAGAAAAWTLRVGLNAALLFLCTAHFIPQIRGTIWQLLGVLAAALGVLIGLTLTHGFWPRLVAVVVLVAGASYLSFSDLAAVVRRREPVAAS